MGQRVQGRPRDLPSGCHALSTEPASPGAEDRLRQGRGERKVSAWGPQRSRGGCGPWPEGPMSPQVVTSRVRDVKALSLARRVASLGVAADRVSQLLPLVYVLPHHPALPAASPLLPRRRGSPGAGGSAGLPSEPTAPKRHPGSRCTRSRSWYPSRRQNLGKEKGRALLEPPPPPPHACRQGRPGLRPIHASSRSGPPLCARSHSPVPLPSYFILTTTS